MITSLLFGTLIRVGLGQAGQASGLHRAETFVVAAFNSSDSARAGADFVCSGNDDQVVINKAIVQLPAFGGKIVFRVGEYHLSGSVVIDRSNVDLEGEIHPAWGGYIHGWTKASEPAGVEGTDSAKFKAVESGFNLIQIEDRNVPDNGEARHRGIRIAKLYLFGHHYTDTGIAGGNKDDSGTIEDNFIQQTANGIDVQIDSAEIRWNDVQDISGDAMRFSGYLGRVYSNLIYDLGGNGIVLSDIMGTVITQNNIGDTVYGAGVVLDGSISTVVSGNSFRGALANSIRVNGGSGHSITGNTFYNMDGGTYVSAKTDGNVIEVAKGSNIAITGNVFTSTVATRGYAISVSDAARSVLVSNNVTGQAYRAGGATRILWHASPGSVANNMGDSGFACGGGDGPAVISSGAWVGWWNPSTFRGEDGAAVTGWRDSSGNFVLLRPTTTKITYSMYSINGHPGLRFDMASPITSTELPELGKTFVVYVVYRADSEGRAHLFEATTVGSTRRIRLDGRPVDATELLIGVDGGQLSIGGGSHGFRGGISEVAIASGELSGADRIAVQKALISKYGIRAKAGL